MEQRQESGGTGRHLLYQCTSGHFNSISNSVGWIALEYRREIPEDEKREKSSVLDP
jgi:hypothetical protein